MREGDEPCGSVCEPGQLASIFVDWAVPTNTTSPCSGFSASSMMPAFSAFISTDLRLAASFAFAAGRARKIAARQTQDAFLSDPNPAAICPKVCAC